MGYTWSSMPSLSLAFALVIPSKVAAAPPTKDACSEAHATAQELRLDGKLIESRERLRVCADTACPRILQAECTEWLSQVELSVPSVELLIEAEGGDPTGARVFLGGEPLPAPAGPIELNPGAHRFRFELDGFPTIEETVVLRQDEKRRVIPVRFRKEQLPAPGSPLSPAPGTGVPPFGPKPPRADGPRPVPVTSWIFGGIALAAAGGSAYFGLSGLGEYSDQKDGCAPTCPDSDVDALKTELLVADALGGVAIVSAGLAAYFFFTRPVVERAAVTTWSRGVRVAWSTDRVGVGFGGEF